MTAYRPRPPGQYRPSPCNGGCSEAARSCVRNSWLVQVNRRDGCCVTQLRITIRSAPTFPGQFSEEARPPQAERGRRQPERCLLTDSGTPFGINFTTDHGFTPVNLRILHDLDDSAPAYNLYVILADPAPGLPLIAARADSSAPGLDYGNQ